MKVFDENNIILCAKPADKIEAIKMSGMILHRNGYVKQTYINDMLEREKIVTTYIGNNVSIPHGLSNSGENILHSGLSFVQVPDGIEFGTEEESKIAYLVIGIAGKNGEHMEMLGKLAMTLTDMEKVEKLRTAHTKTEVMDIFQAAAI